VGLFSQALDFAWAERMQKQGFEKNGEGIDRAPALSSYEYDFEPVLSGAFGDLRISQETELRQK